MKKIVQMWFGKTIPQILEKYIASAMKVAQDNGIEYELIRECKYPQLHPSIACDLMRLEMAAENRWLIYVDCDIMLNQLPKFEKGKFYIGKWRAWPDSCLFYVNGRSDVAKRILERNPEVPRRIQLGRFVRHYSQKVWIPEINELKWWPKDTFGHLLYHRIVKAEEKAKLWQRQV